MSAVDALQEALVSEHALVHAFASLGARTSQSGAPDLFEDLREAHHEHRRRRDALRSLIVEAGAEPVAAAPAYDVPDAWNRASAIAPAAADLERSSTAAMAALVARTSGETRRWALAATIESATREQGFGGVASVWPGAPELEE